MDEEKLGLFKKGCLGTCWYGKYHYMEPWVGCSHDCPYCYAKFREAVNDKLKELNTVFNAPKILLPEKQLLEEIDRTLSEGKIEILKLSRFTDIFVPEFVKNGLSLEILTVLVKSPVKRIIITTKGIPDEKNISLISSNPSKFSYNIAIRPSNLADMKEKVLPAEERINAAAKINSSGVLTTLHLDPFVAGFDDGPSLEKLLSYAKKEGIKRVMFSYLLLSEAVMDSISRVLPEEIFYTLKEQYNFEFSKQYLPKQKDTTYFALKNEVKKDSVEKTARILNKMGFEFVLCSLKNVPGMGIDKFEETRLCDGKFYA